MNLTRKVVGKAILSSTFVYFTPLHGSSALLWSGGGEISGLGFAREHTELFRAIERQSSYRFEYDQDAIEAEGKRVNVRVEEWRCGGNPQRVCSEGHLSVIPAREIYSKSKGIVASGALSEGVY